MKQAEDVRTDFDTVAASPRCIDKVGDDVVGRTDLYFMPKTINILLV